MVPHSYISDKKQVVSNFVVNFFDSHPQYKTDYNFPKPIYPQKLSTVDLSKKEFAQLPIAEIQKSVLCGTCLADGSLKIQPRYANARIQNRHSTRQAEWFMWKWLVCLKDFTNGQSSIVFQESDGFQKRSKELEGETLGKLKIATKACKELTGLHKMLCDSHPEKTKRKLVIERKWLNHQNNYFLMTVWCDDGSLTHQRQGDICLDAVSAEQQQVFVKYLKNIWDIDCYVQPTDERMKNGQIRHRIKVSDQENLLKFLRLVAPVIPVKSMLYKITFVPSNNRELLQRWATEVEGLVLPEFKEYMRNTYAEILKNF